MQTIRARLALNYFIVLSIGMALVGGLMWFAVSRLYIDTQRENILAQAKLIAASLQDAPLPAEPAQPYSQASNMATGIHTRILGESGAVIVGLPLADVSIHMPEAEAFASIPPSELVQRPEIESALKGIPDTAIRAVIQNRRVLYAAAPIQNSDGHVMGIVYIAMPLPAGGLPMDILLQLLLAVLAAMVIAAIAGRMLARGISSPLEKLADAVTAVSKGNLDLHVSAKTDITELHSVGQTFNEMVAALRRADEVKKAFVADVTHELRTPLTVIKGTIETLEDGALDDLDGRKPLLSSMMHETDRLIRMVGDLLTLTRADAGALQLNLQDFDLVELAQMRSGMLGLMAGERSVELQVIGDLQTILVSADPDRISQVLNNLLDNAVRHSPPQTVVTVTVSMGEDGVECSVTDQGKGIPAEHLPFIFDRFYRIQSSRDRLSGGTGLGLAIARALVHAHGGTILAASEEDRGTTVTFWLPSKK